MLKAKTDFHIVFLVSLCLISGIICVYIQAVNYDFVGYDDELYVTKNLHVQKGISLEGLKWAFTTSHSGNWHPLTWLSHMLDYKLYGLNPAGHHWINVEFHIANTLLLFFILFRMTGALWKSAFVAALFALHPLHVESVAWISERKDVLSTFFGLLTIAAYYRYVKKSSATNYLLVFIFLCLGLMVKPILVTIPFVLLLLDFWPLKRFQYKSNFLLKSEKANDDAIRRNHRIILEKIPLFIPVAISCILTFLAQKSEGAVKPLYALALKYRVANALVSYTDYILKTIWPHKLAVFYPHPGNTLPSWQIVGATLLIVAACYWAIRATKKYPYIPVGLFWYLGTLVPVIGLVQVGDQAMADRYTYIPLTGIFIIVSWGVSDIFKKWHYRRFFLVVFAAILLAGFTSKTFLQLKYWKNGITLFEHAVSVTENNYQAHNNLGTAYGSTDLDKAVFHYKAALKIKPEFAMALYNLGTIYMKKGRVDEAVHHYLKAIEIKPDYFDALNNIGIVFLNKGDYNKAVLYFKRALRTDSKKTDARMNLANVLFLQLKPYEAISQYKEILQTDSENANVHYNLAYVLSSQNRIEEAVSQYKEALRVDPKYSKAHYNLGNMLLSQGKIKEAVTHYAKTIKYKPDDAKAYNKVGVILFKQGKFKKAGVFFSRALQLDPGFSEARANLDVVKNATLLK